MANTEPLFAMTPTPDIRRSAAPALLLAIVAGLVTALLYQHGKTTNQSSGLSRSIDGSTLPAPGRAAGRYWFVGEGWVSAEPALPGRRREERPASRASHLHVFNPGPEPLQARVVLYRVTGDPTSFRVTVEARTLETLDLATRREIPRNEAFWVVLESDRPVFPQLAQSDYRPWDPVPDTLDMLLPQPGPADATFTEWVYPDGFQGGSDSWFETETISLLNPTRDAGRATLTFQFRDGRRPRTHRVALPAARVAHIDLSQVFPSGDPTGPPVVSHDYAVRILSDVPIVSQQTRRARWRGTTFPVGSKTGAPIRASEARRAREWYYGGGWIRRLDVLPRDRYDHTWQLLFSYSLAPGGSAMRVQAYPGTGGAGAHPVPLRAAGSDLQWLHDEPWRARLGIDVPWGLQLTSPDPLAAAVMTAEYEPWSQGIPGAMSATPLVPGPLAAEWWMGVSRHGGADDVPVEWLAAWQFLNPGTSPVRVTARFHGEQTPAIERTVTVAPGAVVRLSGDGVPGLATGRPMVVSAVGDGPFLAHAWLRVGARGVPGTRALASSAGVPISLGHATAAVAAAHAGSHR